MTDALDQQWACMTCNSKFRVGEIVPGKLYNDPWPCPRCGSLNISPADGTVGNVPEYFGEFGTKN